MCIKIIVRCNAHTHTQCVFDGRPQCTAPQGVRNLITDETIASMLTRRGVSGWDYPYFLITLHSSPRRADRIVGEMGSEERGHSKPVPSNSSSSHHTLRRLVCFLGKGSGESQARPAGPQDRRFGVPHLSAKDAGGLTVLLRQSLVYVGNSH